MLFSLGCHRSARMDILAHASSDFCLQTLILLAVSGGPDSIALLHALHATGCKIHVAHLNHGLRVEATEDAACVEQFCVELGVPCTIGYVDVKTEKRKRGGSIQEVARAVRYEFLERMADEVGADVIATAHTADDQAETILLNILRGTGTDGLRGIPERRGRIVRPLLGVTRSQIEQYCAENGLHPRQDASNKSTKYARNEVRLKLLPYLEARFNPQVGRALLRLAEIAGSESELLDSMAREWLGQRESLSVADLSALHLALQRRVLHQWLSAACAPREIGFDEVERVRMALAKPFADTLPGGGIIEGDGASLWLRAQASAPERTEPVAVPIDIPGEAVFHEWRVRTVGFVPNGLDAIVRGRRRGERIALAAGHKKLQDLFVDAKIPRAKRDTWPILADAATGEVLAVADLRVSARCPTLCFSKEPL
jgi:tRNA(Ile)-lysidine synthase